MTFKSVSQIFISSQDELVSDPILIFTDVIRNAFVDFNYRLFTNSDVEKFLVKYYPPLVLEAYRGFKPFAYKADLARYCIINIIGGWYIDLSIHWHIPVSISDSTTAVFFRDIQRNSLSSWACSNGCFYSTPNNPVLSLAIHNCCKNYLSRYYGRTPLCPTGPSLFGKAIAQMNSHDNVVFGDFLELTPAMTNKNLAYILPDGKIIAFCKPNGYSITELDPRRTNNYTKLWFEHNIYN